MKNFLERLLGWNAALLLRLGVSEKVPCQAHRVASGPLCYVRSLRGIRHYASRYRGQTGLVPSSVFLS